MMLGRNGRPRRVRIEALSLAQISSCIACAALGIPLGAAIHVMAAAGIMFYKYVWIRDDRELIEMHCAPLN